MFSSRIQWSQKTVEQLYPTNTIHTLGAQWVTPTLMPPRYNFRMDEEVALNGIQFIGGGAV